MGKGKLEDMVAKCERGPNSYSAPVSIISEGREHVAVKEEIWKDAARGKWARIAKNLIGLEDIIREGANESGWNGSFEE